MNRPTLSAVNRAVNQFTHDRDRMGPKQLVFWVLLPLIISGYTVAQECENPDLKLEFSTLVADHEPKARYARRRNTDPRQGHKQGSSIDWHRRLSKLDLASLVPIAEQGNKTRWRISQCRFDSALQIWGELEQELGADHPYIRDWVINQNLALMSCARGIPIKLIRPDQADYWPVRGESDLDYLRAYMEFYTRDNSLIGDLPERFFEIASDPQSKLKARAAAMALRISFLAQGLGAQITMANRLREDAVASTVYASVEEVVFTSYWKISRWRDGPSSPSHAEKVQRLEWLMDIAAKQSLAPQFSENSKLQSEYEFWREHDALYQLKGLARAGHIHLTDRDAGWWLMNELPTNTKPQIRRPVRGTDLHENRRATLRYEKLSKRISNFATLYRHAWHRMTQKDRRFAYFATQVLESPLKDWRWALYDTDSPVWEHSATISGLAVSRYCNNEGVEWLYQAARLMPGGHSRLGWVRKQLERALNDNTLRQTHPLFRSKIFLQAVRLSLLANDHSAALALMTRDDIAVTDLYHTGPRGHHYSRYSGPVPIINNARADAVSKSLAWYAHRGEWDQVQSIFAVCADKNLCHPKNATQIYLPYRHLLAKDSESVYRQEPGWNSTSFLDNLPTRQQLELAEANFDERAKYRRKDRTGAMLVPRIFVRAWLLNQPALLRRAASLYAKHYPEKRFEIFRAIEGDRLDQAMFIMRHQISPFQAPYGLSDLKNLGEPRRWKGLWCQYKREDYQIARETSAEFPPFGSDFIKRGYRRWWNKNEWVLRYQPTQFAAKRREFINRSPLARDTDIAELNQLAQIPPGAKFLAEIVLKAANSVGDERLPEALYLAVRSTRFGCRRGDDYGAVSQAAFSLLHSRYGETIWAKETPYWYR